MTTTIIPAYPGFKVLVAELFLADKTSPKDISEYPVIAWLIDDKVDTFVPEAITQGGKASSFGLMEQVAVEAPSGQVTARDDFVFENRRQWLAHVAKAAKGKGK